MSYFRIVIVTLCVTVPVGGPLILPLLPVTDLHASESSSPPALQPETTEQPERYAGRTIDQWQALIKTLEFSSTEAKRAVPGLIAVCRDPDAPSELRAQSALTLGRIGESARAAVPVLEQLLAKPSGTDQASSAQWAAKALSGFGPLAASATPSLADLAEDADRGLLERQVAMEALGRIGGTHADAIPVLIRLSTADGSQERSDLIAQQVQTTAIDSLMFAGPTASAAVPALIQLTRSPSTDLRRAAAATLGAIGPGAGIGSDALVDLVLFDELLDIRDTAAASLARVGNAGETALAYLLQDEEVLVRSLAASALGGIEQPADSTRNALVGGLNDADADVRLSAAESLVKMNHDVQVLIPKLLESLTEEDRQPRIRAYRLLIEMRNQKELLLPRLNELADDPRPYVRQVAGKAIEQFSQPVPGK
jgi:HEAT repeat protein